MALLLDHLWGEILGRPAESIGHLSLFEDLGETEINDFDVSCVIQENIFKFEISVDDPFRVQVTYSYNELSCEKQSLLLTKPLLCRENFVKFPTSYKWHDKVKSMFVLKKEIKRDQEWMITLKHDIFLSHGTLYLISFNEHILSNRFDCIKLPVMFKLGQEHLAEGAPADDHEKLEIFHGH